MSRRRQIPLGDRFSTGRQSRPVFATRFWDTALSHPWRYIYPAFFLLLTAFQLKAAPVYTESQVKALFLFNFAKYVEWPASAFPSDTAPMMIGVMGQDEIRDHLHRMVEHKSIHGHHILVQQLTEEDDFKCCHILFISAAESSRLGPILEKAGAWPILTVGEVPGFNEQGGMIKFTVKDENVRLEIHLEAARKQNLRISSKLLNVADVVIGK